MAKLKTLVALAGLSSILAGCGAADGQEGLEGELGADPAAEAAGELGSTEQALTDTFVTNSIYWVKRTHIETMYLTAGHYIDWYTTAESGPFNNPNMVLIQYDGGAADPNLGCGVQAASQATFKIMAMNDDSNGNGQPRLKYSVPNTGCYALIVYSLSNGQDAKLATVALHKDTYGPTYKVCNFWCTIQRDKLSSTNQSVPVTGYMLHPPAFNYMETRNPKLGADPWVFIFNFAAGTGASNDDTGWVNGGSVNSTINIPGFSYEGTTSSNYSGVLLTGYNTVSVPPNTPMGSAPLSEWWAFNRTP